MPSERRPAPAAEVRRTTRSGGRGWDRDCLRELKEDMARWHRQDQRFAALFLPQLGHGPWHDFTEGGTDDLLARGRKIISMQDAWMGEILDQLDRAGRLDKTLIVVVGDHGIRARREDRNFRPGMIDDYSFRVPLLVYAPPALQRRTDMAHLTSHVDVAPSLLDLLGIVGGRESEQGTPVWDDRTAGRHVYFLANHLFGADGYFDGRRFFMWNHLSGAVYANDRLHFEVRDLVPKDSPRYREVVDHLRRVTASRRSGPACRCARGPSRGNEAAGGQIVAGIPVSANAWRTFRGASWASCCPSPCERNCHVRGPLFTRAGPVAGPGRPNSRRDFRSRQGQEGAWLASV